MPTHRDEPRCESEAGIFYYLRCIISQARTTTHRSTRTSCEAHLGVESPIRSHRTAPAQWRAGMPFWSPLRPRPKATNPRLERTAAMAVALSLSLGSGS